MSELTGLHIDQHAAALAERLGLSDLQEAAVLLTAVTAAFNAGLQHGRVTPGPVPHEEQMRRASAATVRILEELRGVR